MKEEAARIARQQEFEEEQRLEVISLCLATPFQCDVFIAARARRTQAKI